MGGRQGRVCGWVGGCLGRGGSLTGLAQVGRVGQAVPCRSLAANCPCPKLPTIHMCVRVCAGDLGGVTGDKRVTSNLKQLIEALSRIVAD